MYVFNCLLYLSQYFTLRIFCAHVALNIRVHWLRCWVTEASSSSLWQKKRCQIFQCFSKYPIASLKAGYNLYGFSRVWGFWGRLALVRCRLELAAAISCGRFTMRYYKISTELISINGCRSYSFSLSSKGCLVLVFCFIKTILCIPCWNV